MPHFGTVSESRLITCHPQLIEICRMAIEHYDFHVVSGYRDELVQEMLFLDGKTLAHWPDSLHNNEDDDGEPLSLAVDLVSWINGKCKWGDMLELGCLAGVVFTCADILKIKLRWGPRFMPDHLPDAYHFELKDMGG